MNFRTKTILGIAAIEAALLGILIYSGLGYLRDSNARQLIDRADSLAAAFVSMTKDAVLSTDLASLETFADELMKNPGMEFVRVIDGQQRVLATRGDLDHFARPLRPHRTIDEATHGVFVARKPIEEAGVTYGNVELGVSTAQIESTYQAAQRWAIGLGALEMVLVALFSFVLGTYLTRLLHRLTDGANAIADGRVGLEIPVVGRDELARTAVAFNTMSAQLAADQKTRAAMLHSALDAIVVMDDVGSVLEFNPAAESLFGYQRAEAIGQKLGDLIIPVADRHRHAHGLDNYKATGDSAVLDQRTVVTARRSDDSEFRAELSVTAMRIDDRDVFTGFVRDVTEEQRARLALIESEARFRDFASTASDFFFELDQHGCFGWVSDRFGDICQLTAAEVEGKLLTDLKHFEIDAEDAAIWHDRIAGREHFRDLRVRFNAADSTLHHVALNARAVWTAGGQFTGYRGTGADITEAVRVIHAERERAEEEVHRTMLERSNRDLQEFAYIASHDMQEPLRKIRTFGDRIVSTAHDKLDDRQKDYLDRMVGAAQRMQALIDGLLTYSRVQTEWNEREDVELNDVVANVLVDLDETIARAGATVEVGELPCVRGIGTQLGQLFLNLILNGLKFQMEGSKPTIRVSAEFDRTQGKGVWRVFVQDNGIGIEPEHRETIFGVFQRLHSRATYAGTGIGLAVCRRIMERHSGTIEVVSTSGEGAKFALEFPKE